MKEALINSGDANFMGSPEQISHIDLTGKEPVIRFAGFSELDADPKPVRASRMRDLLVSNANRTEIQGHNRPSPAYNKPRIPSYNRARIQAAVEREAQTTEVKEKKHRLRNGVSKFTNKLRDMFSTGENALKNRRKAVAFVGGVAFAATMLAGSVSLGPGGDSTSQTSPDVATGTTLSPEAIDNALQGAIADSVAQAAINAFEQAGDIIMPPIVSVGPEVSVNPEVSTQLTEVDIVLGGNVWDGLISQGYTPAEAVTTINSYEAETGRDLDLVYPGETFYFSQQG